MKWILLVVALCIPASASASAIGKDALEVGASGNFTHQSFENSLGSITSIRAGIDFARAVTREVQIGARLGLDHQSIDLGSGGETDGGSIDAVLLLRVNFGGSPTLIPYGQVAGGVIAWVGDLEGNEITRLFPELTVGLRIVVNELASFNIAGSWRAESDALSYDGLDATTLQVMFGFSIFPRGLDGTR